MKNRDSSTSHSENDHKDSIFNQDSPQSENPSSPSSTIRKVNFKEKIPNQLDEHETFLFKSVPLKNSTTFSKNKKLSNEIN